MTPIVLILTATLALPGVVDNASAQTVSPQRKPRLIQLDQAAAESMDVFKGPPETCTMRSGFMVLAQSKSVGKHSTGNNEEALIVLAGTGELRITGGPVLKLKPYCVTYCPPTTEHDVINTGSDTLRYVWLVARAKP